ncbi:type II secretion system protein [Desulfurivibrio dismutans]|uniref:type II secretion system protein n=1 Tax=Desulfurivibrio dismutans TaxID=1398908 RepID=UPI0023DA0B2C|nr:type II secretion system protein [Desulfurivibrio alkaliphilus]MDF1615443.1 type II secretion system protein [Desulfurivibrio alkaliphilus]
MIRPEPCQSGFTLLEIIITIVVAALAGLVAFTFVSHTVVRSSEPIHSAQALAQTRVPLETLTASYHEYLREELDWGEFESELDNLLAAYGGTKTDVSADFDGDFEVLQVTFTGAHGQELTAFFSE